MIRAPTRQLGGRRRTAADCVAGVVRNDVAAAARADREQRRVVARRFVVVVRQHRFNNLSGVGNNSSHSRADARSSGVTVPGSWLPAARDQSRPAATALTPKWGRLLRFAMSGPPDTAGVVVARTAPRCAAKSEKRPFGLSASINSASKSNRKYSSRVYPK